MKFPTTDVAAIRAFRRDFSPEIQPELDRLYAERRAAGYTPDGAFRDVMIELVAEYERWNPAEQIPRIEIADLK